MDSTTGILWILGCYITNMGISFLRAWHIFQLVKSHFKLLQYCIGEGVSQDPQNWLRNMCTTHYDQISASKSALNCLQHVSSASATTKKQTKFPFLSYSEKQNMYYEAELMSCIMMWAGKASPGFTPYASLVSNMVSIGGSDCLVRYMSGVPQVV